MSFRELNDASYSALRKNLTREKGSTVQRKFLEVLKDSEEFVQWFEGEVKSEESDDEFDLLSDQLSEHEFKEPTQQVEEELFEKWKAVISPAQACRSSFWGYVTLRHIKEGKIESSFLAANGGSLPGGLERIDKALKSGDASSMDGITRAAIRRLSGLPEARGNRTVYVNCPFARAWWRCHIAKNVCEATAADSDKVMGVLRVSQAYWESLVSSVVSKNSVFGDEKIRATLIWILSEKYTGKKSPIFSDTRLKRTIKKIGVRLAWQELAVFNYDELKEIFKAEFLA